MCWYPLHDPDRHIIGHSHDGQGSLVHICWPVGVVGSLAERWELNVRRVGHWVVVGRGNWGYLREEFLYKWTDIEINLRSPTSSAVPGKAIKTAQDTILLRALATLSQLGSPAVTLLFNQPRLNWSMGMALTSCKPSKKCSKRYVSLQTSFKQCFRPRPQNFITAHF